MLQNGKVRAGAFFERFESIRHNGLLKLKGYVVVR